MNALVRALVRFLLVLVCVGGLPATGAAQVSAGFVAGVALSTVHGPGKDSLGGQLSSRTGFVGGGVLNVELLGSIINLRPEVLYVQKGVTITDPISGNSLGLKVDYIEVPVLLAFGIPTSGGIRPELFIGPQVSFNTRCRLTGTQTGQGSQTQTCDELMVPISSTDFGLLVGAGIQTANGFLAQIGFDYGLNRLEDEDSTPEIKNQSWYFLVGWLFGL